MPKLSKLQKSFIAAIAAGVTLPDALADHQLKWGTIAAWRRWNRLFRTEHNRAQKIGIPKRRLVSSAVSLRARFGASFSLAPNLAKLVEEYTRPRVHSAGGCALLCPTE